MFLLLYCHGIAMCPKFKSYRCQPSRNRAGNPAFWLISRIPAFLRERLAFLALFRNTAIHYKFSCTETFCSKKLYENVMDSIT